MNTQERILFNQVSLTESSNPQLPNCQLSIAIVPAMAFDKQGHRLGRGKGYYDRFLSRIPNIYKIGVCFPFQMLESIPSESTDVVMDEVITSLNL